MKKDKYGHNVNEKGVEIKASTSGSGKTKIDFYDCCPAENEKHGSIHINFDENTGKGTITDTTNGKIEKTDTKCYLTTACMHHYLNNFDDNCHELTLLRWFRDKFVSLNDIKHYYTTAPIIVDAINNSEDCEKIYKDIYENVIKVCVESIENGYYEFAYATYMISILNLEKEFARPALNTRMVRALKNRLVSAN